MAEGESVAPVELTALDRRLGERSAEISCGDVLSTDLCEAVDALAVHLGVPPEDLPGEG